MFWRTSVVVVLPPLPFQGLFQYRHEMKWNKREKKKQRPTIKRFNQWLRIKIAIQNEDLDSKKGLKFVNLLISWGMLYVVCVIGIDNWRNIHKALTVKEKERMRMRAQRMLNQRIELKYTKRKKDYYY